MESQETEGVGARFFFGRGKIIMGNITEHFSWEEAETTSHRGVDNKIPPELQRTIINTARQMERVRAVLGNRGIHVNSWYRSPELNKIVGGSATSQHSKGEAVDFVCPDFGGPLDICRKIIQYKELIRFDQLIYEHTWVHISFKADPKAEPRGKVLTLLNGGNYANGLTNKQGVPV